MILFIKIFTFIRFYYIGILLLIPVQITAQTISYGDTVALGSGFAFTWIETDAQNIPIRIGVSLTEAAVDSPAAGLKSVDFPMVSSDSLFRHALFAFEPVGHGPVGIYNVPHFDIHFYMITKEERVSIEHGTDTTTIPSAYMPEDYRPVDGFLAVFQMGIHFVDSLAEEVNGQPFRRTVLYGFYKAKMIFVEPMITREFLLTDPDTTLTIKQPAAYQRTAYYPESYAVKFNPQNNMYEIFITDFILRTSVTSADNPDILNNDYVLYQNYPNPFNPNTTFRYSVPEESKVTIKIFDMIGNEIETLINEEKSAGSYELKWTADDLPSGVYFYRLQAGSFIQTRKMIVLK